MKEMGGERKLYAGCNRMYTADQWSDMLDISASKFRWLIEKGMTVEQMFQFFQVEFVEPKPKKRKQREGCRMAETRQLVADLLTRSGYSHEAEEIEIKVRPNGIHWAILNKRLIGAYEYKTGILNLKYGGCVPLKDELSDKLKIYWDAKYDKWCIDEDSKGLLVDRALAKIRGENPGPIDYSSVMKKEKEPVPRQLYEYNGKQATCAEWSRRLHIPKCTLGRWLNRGYSIEEILAERKEKQI